MAKMAKQGNTLSLDFTAEEARELGLEEGKDYELHTAKKGIWVLSEKQAEKNQMGAKEAGLEANILDLMLKKSLSDKVEGKFEKFLNGEELDCFKKMLENGKIIAFKLSDKYKKAVYKIAPDKKKESENPEAKEKPIEEYSLESDGFLVVKNEERAKKLSEQLKREIQDGRIRGLKSFDGHFYIVESALLEKYSGDACIVIKANNSLGLQQLSQKLTISKTLARIVCEFLKEDGEIIEKRKEAYQLV